VIEQIWGPSPLDFTVDSSKVRVRMRWVEKKSGWLAAVQCREKCPNMKGKYTVWFWSKQSPNQALYGALDGAAKSAVFAVSRRQLSR
jgi:hypothetical protein